ncbi:unnamed protein product [Prorocentrum cordatum]|uniref:EGF-like domain-containing protein n=1 Tax=Prorocentrum cordatum TaxID=2364126 RepID=A0ABN9YKX2_9DINO|nr:unnamed protein product [Polarella glacialis]
MTPPATASMLPANACTGCQCPRDNASWREYDVGVACDVVDGSAFSSQAPCMCGDTRCKQSEVCTYSPFVELCQRSGALVLRSPCMLGGSPLIFEYECNTYFDAPVYSAVGGYYPYWDYGCAGVIGSPAIWVFDTDEPARAPRQTDLDGDSACNVLAYINSYEISGPPPGTQNWTISCDTGADKESEIIIEHLYGPLPAVESTGDACPCAPWATATVTTSATSTSTVTLSGTSTTFATETAPTPAPPPTPAPTAPTRAAPPTPAPTPASTDSDCPDNSTGHSVGHGCVCDAGYSGSIWPARDYPFYNGSCIAVNCPEHSTGVSAPDSCTCEPGHMGAIRPASEAPFYNGSCVAVECPAGSSGTSVANGCVCNLGYSGTWTCEAGYSDTITATTIEPYYSGSCEAVNCPGNSTGNSVADGCACNAGFEGVINPISEPPFYSGTCTVLGCSAAPTHAPTALPTYSPTSAPTVSPTASPTLVPTFLPTPAPTFLPTPAPTHLPGAPTPPPTVAPTFAPTSAPTLAPTLLPCAKFDEAGTSYPCKCGTATCNQDELCYFASSTCAPACSNIDATDLFDTTVGRCGRGANICTTTNSNYCHKESNRCIACSSEGTCDDVVYVCEGFEVLSHAWQGRANLRNAVIPSSIYLIGEFAFADSPLQSVSIPEGALIIRNSAFENTSLTEVRLPSTPRAVFDRAFWSNSYLRHMTMFFPKPS